MSTSFLEQVDIWQKAPFDNETQQAVAALKNNPEALEDAFYKDLEFGTGGMRGVMGVGTNRVNKYTFGRTTQGLSNYINSQFTTETPRVVIGYDCRHNSKELAEIVADIFAANNIDVFLFTDLRATPEVSFAVRHLGCHCGVVLTASHNPPEYNGYKVYWQDGGQIVPPQDRAIIDEINRTNYQDIRFDTQQSRIQHIDSDVDHAFQKASVEVGRIGNGNRSAVKIVFTSLHGTSITAIPQVLKAAGYDNVSIIEEQAKPDGNFPTVNSPNPEEPEALKIAMQKANDIGADIVIGTDPDADRLGIAVRNENNELELLNGNQTMVAMTDFILSKGSFTDTDNAFVGSTIVSTPMMLSLAKHYGIECKLGLTGFKWIAQMIEHYPNQKCLGGGEESFGFMVGDFVRDKDAVTAALLACELAAEAKSNGSSFFKTLLSIYNNLGLFQERLVSLVKKGKAGAAEIETLMKELRNNPPKTLDGNTITHIEDYASATRYSLQSQEKEIIPLPKANVLIFIAEDGTRVAARPSGTEPKIKFYLSVNTSLNATENYRTTKAVLDQKINRILTELGIS
ncbi:MAG: phospho-sugar mutase [Flavobacteriales bacterium]|nr:MAG: phospho-sugar mutase [Flavobacteriales bacterium]|tara:strand:- start:6470 stop:8176 length:1707 start_codon:yes stop_codon:yes gene_type:complete